MKRFALLLLSILLSSGWLFSANRVEICSQAGFDRLSGDLDALCHQPGDSLVIHFAPGVYSFSEQHLSLRHIDLPRLQLVLEGEGATFIACGETLCLKDAADAAPLSTSFSLKDGWVDLDRMRAVDMRGKVGRCQSYPIPALFSPGLWKIRCPEPDLSEAEASDTYIIITQWFVGAVYKVHFIRNGFVYFKRDTKHRTHLYSELRFGRCKPRYLLFNQDERTLPLYVQRGALHSREGGHFHRCLQSGFLSLKNSRIGSLTLRGCRFLGNREGDALLQFQGVEADSLLIEDNLFEGIKSTVVSSQDGSNLFFRKNRVVGCYLKALYSDPYSTGLQVTDNSFEDSGRMFTNAPVVHCQGSGFRIAGNRFRDFTYSAIGLGVHYADPAGKATEGVVERNEIWYTDPPAGEERRVLIDGGAIYVWTQNKHLVIRRNYIHDITGYHGYRGIFCDDGVQNVDIYENLVLRVRNVHPSYCIDLRKHFSVQGKAGSKVHLANVGNRMWGNTVDGRVRFYIRRNDPGSFRGENILLPKDYDREAVVASWRKQIDESPDPDA